jgi:hypothetical protein
LFKHLDEEILIAQQAFPDGLGCRWFTPHLLQYAAAAHLVTTKQPDAILGFTTLIEVVEGCVLTVTWHKYPGPKVHFDLCKGTNNLLVETIALEFSSGVNPWMVAFNLKDGRNIAKQYVSPLMPPCSTGTLLNSV